MVRTIFKLAVVVAVLAFGKYLIDNEADRRLDLAKEMYESKEYEEALAELRNLEKWLFWTPAAKESNAVREQARKRIVAKRDADQRDREQRQWQKDFRQEEDARQAETKRQERWESEKTFRAEQNELEREAARRRGYR